jgi:hypothetical protein
MWSLLFVQVVNSATIHMTGYFTGYFNFIKPPLPLENLNHFHTLYFLRFVENFHAFCGKKVQFQNPFRLFLWVFYSAGRLHNSEEFCSHCTNIVSYGHVFRKLGKPGNIFSEQHHTTETMFLKSLQPLYFCFIRIKIC